jgi:hypothetical protein
MSSSKKCTESIKVVVRIRPLNTKEIKEGHKVVTTANEVRRTLETFDLASSEKASKTFSFDAVFSDKSTQKLVYDVCAAPVVQSVLQGYNGTIFCYGQTGAGKTHTMEGKPNPPDSRGLIPSAFQQMYDHVALANVNQNEKYLVRASYFEIYNEEIRDLLFSPSKKIIIIILTLWSLRNRRILEYT